VRFLNAIDRSPALPRVVGVLATSPKRYAEFIAERDIRFATVRIHQSLMSRLAPSVPTTVLIKSGSIESIWIGAMPTALYARFKEAVVPGAAPMQDAAEQDALPGPAVA
jgi:hypothetical protein